MNATFEQLAEPFRQELKRHCYCMLGSVHEAEDLVQETYLRAWRSFDRFEGRGTFRAWLYQIATHACLNALASRKSKQRLLPDQWSPAATDMPDGVARTDVAWLEPYPDAYLESIADESAGPEALYAGSEVVRLAFVAIIQQLPPRQRAVLLLCDVLGWSTQETAELLGSSPAAVNSARQRARETLAQRYPDGLPSTTPSSNPAEQELLSRYVRAWEARDLDGFVALLKDDVTYTMPPFSQWYAGRAEVHAFFAWAWTHYDGFRLVPTAANRQPAFAAYFRARADPLWMAHSIHVLALVGNAISSLTLFMKPAGPQLFGAFGLPLTFTNMDSRFRGNDGPL
ncbi:RNA polymerase sigma factor [Dyella nitratireducens]|uniref:RNA polymerase sigma factor n=2 Tax=Dyella nitratireducens TaxID=1849580 RepID=A0ABQ1GAC0_9GAMM|nr:RNA polymerase sigma factor [Dyella nitratireducens]GLQ40488.1 RNA polymerase sigma factor [Dyella nitratireducens]